jgi:GTPase SAR1 family protein
MDPRLTALFIDPGSLVGLEGPVEELSKIVMDTDGRTDLKIVSIVGMAGAGKTTLANAFYRRLEVQNGFHCRAFVSVGQKPDLIRILTDIFSQLGDRHRGGQDINQVIDSIRNLLNLPFSNFHGSICFRITHCFDICFINLCILFNSVKQVSDCG